MGISPSESEGASVPPRLDTSSAHSARVWNYLLGGKDNFAADREVGDMILQMFPGIAHIARLQRRFLGRAVRYLAGEAGIRQFLDIGTGLPTADNTHEVAQLIVAQARVVYVDNDPIVLAHARALLTSDPRGATAYIDADVREPATILDAAARTLDFDRPVAVMLLGILNFVTDDTQAQELVAALTEAVPVGSYLVISHPTREVNPEAVDRAVAMWNDGGAAPMAVRDPAQIARFFAGWQLVEPGLVTCSQWRPDGNDTSPASEYAGVARKDS